MSTGGASCIVPYPPGSRTSPWMWEEWGQQEQNQIQIEGPGWYGPPTANERQKVGGGGHGGWTISHSEVCSQEEQGAVIGVPDTCLAWDIKDVQGGVIGHEGTCAVGGLVQQPRGDRRR